MDYLHDQKFVGRRVIIGDDTEVCLDPPQPDLSLKGWTVASLMRRVDEWKAHRTDTPERRLIRWARSGIGDYRREEDEGRAWTIRELLDSDELAAEGKAMAHCVATYAEYCTKGASAIWSLGIEGQGDRRRMLTIEVAPGTREVVQAKMKDNDDPDEASRALVEDWARQEGLDARVVKPAGRPPLLRGLSAPLERDGRLRGVPQADLRGGREILGEGDRSRSRNPWRPTPPPGGTSSGSPRSASRCPARSSTDGRASSCRPAPCHKESPSPSPRAASCPSGVRAGQDGHVPGRAVLPVGQLLVRMQPRPGHAPA